ncbi:MAG: alpha/beta hydrolase [Alphaproteobacteria bacterium]|nr:alpha/beta hydrolase [Alphaproteobacteria bacterium]
MNSLITSIVTAATSFWLHLQLNIVNLPFHFSAVEIVPHISYGTEPWQTADIYIPHNPDQKKFGVVVFFYGGRWTYGKKEDYHFIGNRLAEENFITVIPDYQKFPIAHFPSFVEDGAKAVSWVYDNINKYHGDKTHINVMGHSAGGHIGALLCADERYLMRQNKTIHGVIHQFVGLAGPYAFTPDEPDLEAIFAPPEQYAQMQVPTFIKGNEPPMLLMWGENDKDVGRFNMERLQSRIEEKKGVVHSIALPNIDHIGMLAAFTWLDDKKQPIMKNILDFLRK